MKAKLKTLKRGQTFYGAGIQWLVLGHTNSSQGLPIVTHIVSTGIVERRAFDEKNRNDLGVSTLLAYLNGEFLERLEDAFGEGAVAEHFIDLTSNDGLKDYGNVKTKVGLLTEEEYRQHRDILPPLGDEGWWWLATPYSTERAGYPSYVRGVYSDGALYYCNAYYGYRGVRPALYLKSDISVSLDGNDESTIEVSEEELYKAAVQKFGERAQIPAAIFVGSMADLFGRWVPDDWIEQVFDACRRAPRHTYLFLTKNPKRYCDLASSGKLPTEPNFWYGTTITGPDMPFFFWDKANTFASIEPLLEPFEAAGERGNGSEGYEKKVEWVIIGAMTGPGSAKKQPKREWIQAIVDDASITGVPVFMKDSLKAVWGDDLIREYPSGMEGGLNR